MENVSGKKKKENGLNRSCHIFQPNRDRGQQEKVFFGTHQAFFWPLQAGV